MQIRKHGKPFISREFYTSLDTQFRADSGFESIHVHRLSEQTEMFVLYYPNGVVQREDRTYHYDGMGGTSSEDKYYDTLGIIDSSFSIQSYMPADATGHLDVCGVITSKYFTNGKLSKVAMYDVHYEGGNRCPCGTWEYYDGNGELLKKEVFKKCGDGKTDCESY